MHSLEVNGIEAVDLSEDEFSKSHVRHLVGGRSTAKDERVFRFGPSSVLIVDRRVGSLSVAVEFPERPGALGKFLAGMKPDWNISMFHYRNHGSGQLSDLCLSSSADHLCCCRCGESTGRRTSTTECGYGL